MPRKDQKQIAQKYAGNLRYFNRLHPFRRMRFLLAFVFTAVAMALGAIYLVHWRVAPGEPVANGGPSPKVDDQRTIRPFEWLNSAGGISQAHSRYAQDCEVCHDPKLQANAAQPAVIKAALDAKCETCHNQPPYTFHQVNLVSGLSCTDCHHEHMGTGPMQPVADSNCLSCHGNADVMAQSSQLGKDLPATMSPFHVDTHLVFYQPALDKLLRPPEGYTKVFQSFADGHPDFQIQRENLSDPNTLKFDHKFHFSDQVRTADGKQLSCETCHKPDSRGAYMQPITFANNCQECHAIKIDPALADFTVPHPTGPGGVSTVRSFLQTLPAQYANYAEQVKKITQTDKVNAFVGKRMAAIQQRVRSGEKLEQEVFFSDGKFIHYGGTEVATERALFPGCAECHEVKSASVGDPKITTPVIPDRWYVHAKFDHAAHIAVRSCEECHTLARQSEKTSDILLPDKASCVTCHSPKGGVASNCTTCHDFHNESPAHGVADTTPLKQMLLGGSTSLVKATGKQ